MSFPYALKAIGDKAFYGCDATKYVFGGIAAPVLEAGLVSASDFAEKSDLYKLFDRNGGVVTEKYYANFKNYLALAMFAGKGGVTGVKDFGLTAEFAENAKGFDNRIYKTYFSTMEKTATIADDTTRECIELLREIPAKADVEALKAGDESLWNAYKTKMSKARGVYDNVSVAQRTAFVSDWQKLLDSEAAMRAKASVFGETVEKKSISVTVRPDKTNYVVGEKFDPTGMALTLLWSDGSKEEITSGYDYTKTKLSESNRTVKVTYEGLSTTLNVSVVMPEIEKVEIASAPSVLEYEIGETFLTGGLTLKVTYVDGSTKVVYKGFTVSGDKFETAGKHTITIEYEGRSVGVEVTVIDPDNPEPDTPDEPVVPDKPSKKGCKGSASTACATLLAAGFAVIVKKRKTK